MCEGLYYRLNIKVTALKVLAEKQKILVKLNKHWFTFIGELTAAEYHSILIVSKIIIG